ncbi:DUF192 domain-containing protein [Roseibium sp. MB-4]
MNAYQLSRSVALALCVGFAILLSAVSNGSFAGNSQTPPTEPLTVFSGANEHRFTVEVASTDTQRAKGLMFREEMAAEHGMLFIFDGEFERHFWMKNTPLPLDIIFISSQGTIVSIAADTTPYSEKVIPSGAPAKFVLELNAGTAAKLGIKPGDEVVAGSMGLNDT